MTEKRYDLNNIVEMKKTAPLRNEQFSNCPDGCGYKNQMYELRPDDNDAAPRL